MKKVFLILAILITFSSFAQLTKEENLSSYHTNEIIVNDNLIASSEIFEFRNEIIFYESDFKIYLFFSLDNQEFKDLESLLTNYNVTKRDKYSLHMKFGGSLYIHFEEINNYLKIHIKVLLENKEYHFPEMNRVQFSRLFRK